MQKFLNGGLVLSFLFNNTRCTHNKVYSLNEGAYCPDCGEEIKISWQILRCSCCSTKRKSHFFINKLVPEEKFCKKCGNPEYFIETKEQIEFFDYDYAIILKEEIKAKTQSRKTLQIWIEEENIREFFIKPKLLPVF